MEREEGDGGGGGERRREERRGEGGRADFNDIDASHV